MNITNSEQMEGLIKIKENLEDQQPILQEFLFKNLKVVWLYFKAMILERGQFTSRQAL